jgi:hypothetical protein
MTTPDARDDEASAFERADGIAAAKLAQPWVHAAVGTSTFTLRTCGI